MRNIVLGGVFASVVVACALASGCGGDHESSEPSVSSSREAAATKGWVDPMLIASAGHGQVFDAKGQPLKLDETTIGQMQAAMKADVLKTIGEKLSPEAASLVKQADALQAQQDIANADKLLLDGAVIWRLLQEGPKDMGARYEWRLETLNANIYPASLLGQPQLDPRVSKLIDLSRYREWIDRYPPLARSYLDRCADLGVPRPPDWAQTGTAWQSQGTLTHNILQPGSYAEVYTYTDPAHRGACIALPRGEGGPGSAAGIICQSATTGAACFWDNKLRGEIPERFVGWRGMRLEIARLKDGSNLEASCTGCHHGNNVFNVSPDDMTWARVLRTLPVGTTFTTNIDYSDDEQPAGRYRYIPITTYAGRLGWDNPYDPSPTCTGCHEAPVAFSNPPPMPPMCASLPGGCYRR